MATSRGEHLRLRSGDVVRERYEILDEVGCGNFSKVYRCLDLQKPAKERRACPLAMKVLKKEYKNDASFEKRMLRILSDRDTEGTARVPKMSEYFEWNDYPVFVMPIYGPSLRARRLGVGRGLITRSKLIEFAFDLLETMHFVHFTCHMVHTDLKPENILIADPNAPDKSFGSSWVVCDFGSASQWRMDRLDSDLISTRPYRAPEVVLGNKWHYAADMWSVGCILYEVAVGHRLFEVRDDSTHLQLMDKRIAKLPELITKHGRYSLKYFTTKGDFLTVSEAVRLNKCRTTSIKEIFREDPEFLNLLQCMFIYDPDKRITASKALQHPVFDAVRRRHGHSADEEEAAAAAEGEDVDSGAAAGTLNSRGVSDKNEESTGEENSALYNDDNPRGGAGASVADASGLDASAAASLSGRPLQSSATAAATAGSTRGKRGQKTRRETTENGEDGATRSNGRASASAASSRRGGDDEDGDTNQNEKDDAAIGVETARLSAKEDPKRPWRHGSRLVSYSTAAAASSGKSLVVKEAPGLAAMKPQQARRAVVQNRASSLSSGAGGDASTSTSATVTAAAAAAAGTTVVPKLQLNDITSTSNATKPRSGAMTPTAHSSTSSSRSLQKSGPLTGKRMPATSRPSASGNRAAWGSPRTSTSASSPSANTGAATSRSATTNTNERGSPLPVNGKKRTLAFSASIGASGATLTRRTPRNSVGSSGVVGGSGIGTSSTTAGRGASNGRKMMRAAQADGTGRTSRGTPKPLSPPSLEEEAEQEEAGSHPTRVVPVLSSTETVQGTTATSNPAGSGKRGAGRTAAGQQQASTAHGGNDASLSKLSLNSAELPMAMHTVGSTSPTAASKVDVQLPKPIGTNAEAPLIDLAAANEHSITNGSVSGGLGSSSTPAAHYHHRPQPPHYLHPGASQSGTVVPSIAFGSLTASTTGGAASGSEASPRPTDYVSPVRQRDPAAGMQSTSSVSEYFSTPVTSQAAGATTTTTGTAAADASTASADHDAALPTMLRAVPTTTVAAAERSSGSWTRMPVFARTGVSDDVDEVGNGAKDGPLCPGEDKEEEEADGTRLYSNAPLNRESTVAGPALVGSSIHSQSKEGGRGASPIAPIAMLSALSSITGGGGSGTGGGGGAAAVTGSTTSNNANASTSYSQGQPRSSSPVVAQPRPRGPLTPRSAAKALVIETTLDSLQNVIPPPPVTVHRSAGALKRRPRGSKGDGSTSDDARQTSLGETDLVERYTEHAKPPQHIIIRKARGSGSATATTTSTTGEGAAAHGASGNAVTTELTSTPLSSNRARRRSSSAAGGNGSARGRPSEPQTDATSSQQPQLFSPVNTVITNSPLNSARGAAGASASRLSTGSASRTSMPGAPSSPLTSATANTNIGSTGGGGGGGGLGLTHSPSSHSTLSKDGTALPAAVGHGYHGVRRTVPAPTSAAAPRASLNNSTSRKSSMGTLFPVQRVGASPPPSFGPTTTTETRRSTSPLVRPLDLSTSLGAAGASSAAGGGLNASGSKSPSLMSSSANLRTSSPLQSPRNGRVVAAGGADIPGHIRSPRGRPVPTSITAASASGQSGSPRTQRSGDGQAGSSSAATSAAGVSTGAAFGVGGGSMPYAFSRLSGGTAASGAFGNRSRLSPATPPASAYTSGGARGNVPQSQRVPQSAEDDGGSCGSPLMQPTTPTLTNDEAAAKPRVRRDSRTLQRIVEPRAKPTTPELPPSSSTTTTTTTTNNVARSIGEAGEDGGGASPPW